MSDYYPPPLDAPPWDADDAVDADLGSHGRGAPARSRTPSSGGGPVKRITVTDNGQGRYVQVSGPARDLLRRNGLSAMRSPVDKAWYLRRDRLGDLLAAAQEAGFVVRLRQGHEVAQ